MNSSPHVSASYDKKFVGRLIQYYYYTLNNFDLCISSSKEVIVLLQNYVPHCSPAEQLPNMIQTVTENRHFNIGAMVSPKSGPGRPSIPQQQPVFNSSGTSLLPPVQAQPIPASSQMPPCSTQVPLPPTPVPHPYQQQGQSASTGNTDISSTGPSSTTNAMFRVQMWSNNFDSGVHSMNHSSVGFFFNKFPYSFPEFWHLPSCKVGSVT